MYSYPLFDFKSIRIRRICTGGSLVGLASRHFTLLRFSMRSQAVFIATGAFSKDLLTRLDRLDEDYPNGDLCPCGR